MKILILLLTLFLSPLTSGEEPKDPNEIRVIARIKSIHHKITVIDQKNHTSVPSALEKKSLEMEIHKLAAGDEALIEGHIVIQKSSADGKQILKPVFLIKAIHPVSLKRLGQLDLQPPSEELHITSQEYDTKKGKFFVNDSVTSAITITASVLLLESLASTNQPIGADKEVTTGLIFSAGALATGAFIYQQLKSKKSH
jgi:hypothetical protein